MGQNLRVSFGRVIRSERSAQSKSQEQFASEIGVHRTYYSAIERGERNLSFDKIELIASHLGMRISEIFLIAEAEDSAQTERPASEES